MRHFFIAVIFVCHCTSGMDQNVRNKDIFDGAANSTYVSYSTSSYEFDGGIQGLNSTISALATIAEQTVNTTVEGIVTMPPGFGFAIGVTTTDNVSTPRIIGCSDGCSDGSLTSSGACTGAGATWSSSPDTIFTRSFVIQDANAGILIAYGLEPPIADTAQSTSMKYILNARNPNIVAIGDRVRLTATRVRRYGNTTGATITNTVPVVTDFSNLTRISSGNSIYFSSQTSALARNSDLYRVRRLEGYVTTQPSNSECISGTSRQFQFNYQKGYRGTLCVGATSYTDAQTCSGSKIPFYFQMSKNLGAGTLSGFDTGDSFSYNFSLGAKVRITGAIYAPRYGGTDSELALMLDQKYQAETIK